MGLLKRLLGPSLDELAKEEVRKRKNKKENSIPFPLSDTNLTTSATIDSNITISSETTIDTNTSIGSDFIINENTPLLDTPSLISQPPKKIVYKMFFNVSGVTFKSGNESRQSMLKKIDENKYPFESIESVNIEPYDYKGENAYYVVINDKKIGCIPKRLIPEFEKYMDYPIELFDLNIVGGDGEDEFGEELSYGCQIALVFLEK